MALPGNDIDRGDEDANEKVDTDLRSLNAVVFGKLSYEQVVLANTLTLTMVMVRLRSLLLYCRGRIASPEIGVPDLCHQFQTQSLSQA